MINNVLGLVDFHNEPYVASLTDSRPLGSTSFIGRFALCDFALSNFANSGIKNVGLLVRSHLRSVTKHLGSRNSWATNTKQSRMITMVNEAAIYNPTCNTDINNILQNDWVLYDTTASYIVVMPTHIVVNLDLRPYLEKHISSGNHISLLYTSIKNPSKSFLSQRLLTVNEDGTLSTSKKNFGTVEEPSLASLGIYIIDRTALVDIVKAYLPTHPTLSLPDMLAYLNENKLVSINAFEYKGYARCIDSFKAYMDVSFELLGEKSFKALFDNSRRIYTLPHETPPSLYGKDADVRNSFVSNGAIIEGTVINSIISRNVKIAKGAVVRDSIIFSNTKIESNAKISHCLIDKYSLITKDHSVMGTKANPTYIRQGAKV